ncbi:integration host factor subunit beta [Nostoc sp. 3335mG]|nr:integration host factor subunit beta [Nostoc sp. 3335mG]
MTRSELVERLAAAYPSLPRPSLERTVKVLFDAMAGQLVRHGRIELRGFGSFSTKQRCARVGRNPRSGTKVEIASKHVPVFRPSSDLIGRLNP